MIASSAAAENAGPLAAGDCAAATAQPSVHAAAYLSRLDWSPEPFRFEAFMTSPPPGTSDRVFPSGDSVRAKAVAATAATT